MRPEVKAKVFHVSSTAENHQPPPTGSTEALWKTYQPPPDLAVILELMTVWSEVHWCFLSHVLSRKDRCSGYANTHTCTVHTHRQTHTYIGGNCQKIHLQIKTWFEVCIFRFVVASSLFLFYTFGWLCDNVGGGWALLLFYLHTAGFMYTQQTSRRQQRNPAQQSARCAEFFFCLKDKLAAAR